jgi:hypothetical protein
MKRQQQKSHDINFPYIIKNIFKINKLFETKTRQAQAKKTKTLRTHSKWWLKFLKRHSVKTHKHVCTHPKLSKKTNKKIYIQTDKSADQSRKTNPA